METPKKLPKEQRRNQLLQIAYEIIRSEGTDALTLARVAEQAGVSKPIAYEHFGTRAGLLIALYRDYDERQTKAMRDAIEADGKTIEDVAAILSAAYIDCAVSCGPESGAIIAALRGSEEMEELLQGCQDSFLEDCRKAFAPFVKLPQKKIYAILLGILGAAESLSQAAASNRLSRADAISALSSVMTGALASTGKAKR